MTQTVAGTNCPPCFKEGLGEVKFLSNKALPNFGDAQHGR